VAFGVGGAGCAGASTSGRQRQRAVLGHQPRR
jgi:hypothetical protein